MKDIEQLATQFRKAIDAALEAGEFDNDSIYRRFPRACCGDTSDLLAQYLLDKGIKTDYAVSYTHLDVYKRQHIKRQMVMNRDDKPDILALRECCRIIELKDRNEKVQLCKRIKNEFPELSLRDISRCV